MERGDANNPIIVSTTYRNGLFDLLFDFILIARNRTGFFQSGINTQLRQNHPKKQKPARDNQYHYDQIFQIHKTIL
jgi:hypothetical protein